MSAPKSKKPVPFSLSCMDCDAGMDIGSREEAILSGWTNVSEDDDPDGGFWWTWLGLCPDCRKTREDET